MATVTKEPRYTKLRNRGRAPENSTRDGEEWRPILGYEGRYEVSNLGRVRSVRYGIVLKNRPHRDRYPKLNLKIGKHHSRSFHPHILVATMFLGPRPPGYVIDHIDGDRTNSAASNLRYVTPAENSYNRKLRGGSLPSTGIPGVFKHGYGGYFARINIGHRNIRLGYYQKIEQAQAAVEEFYEAHPRYRRINQWYRWWLDGESKRGDTSCPSAMDKKLTVEQKRELVKILHDGARASGYETDMWTQNRVARVIQRKFGVRYHFQSIQQLLRTLDWSVHRPIRLTGRTHKHTGIPNVYRLARGGYDVKVVRNRKKIHLGCYRELYQAVAALEQYKAAHSDDEPTTAQGAS